jgi:ADP-heptose:LPS heptosyltransferase
VSWISRGLECVLEVGLQWRRPGATPPFTPDRVRRILVVRKDNIGDVLCTTPALRALHRAFPGAHLTILVAEHCRAAVERNPDLDEVLTYTKAKHRAGPLGLAALWDLARVIRALRAHRCELALVPYINDPDVIPLIYLGGSRIIFRTPGRNTIYRFMVANPEVLSDGLNLEHALVRVATMLRQLGCPVADIAPSLYVDAARRDRAAVWLRVRGVPADAQLVGMHLGASIREKRWPPGNFAEVARALLREDAARWLILTGSPGERRLCESVRAACGAPDRAVNAAGDMPLPDLPALLGRVAWLLANDTGVAHIAYATGTPSLTLFWRSFPELSGPLHGQDRHRVLYKGEQCRDCGEGQCVYPACANAIMLDEVLAVARAALGAAITARGPA